MPFDGNHHLEKRGRAVVRTDKYGRRLAPKPSDDLPMKTFRDAVRFEVLVEALEMDEKFDAFLDDLKKPSGKDRMASLCRKHGVTLHELQLLYQDQSRHLALLEASNGLPEIMGDVVADARNKLVNCGRCEGKGMVVKTRTDRRGNETQYEVECPACEGDGKIVESGDKHARDIVFETMKLTGQKGPMVAIQQNFGGAGTGLDSKMEETLKLGQTITLKREDD